MSHVKVGQVWASKYTGKQARVYGEDDHGWMMEWDRWGPAASKRFAISESWLTDDYVLVKDAEEAGATATKTGGVPMVTVHGNAPLDVAAKHVAEAINNAAAGWSATSESNTVTVTQRHDFTGVVEEVK